MKATSLTERIVLFSNFLKGHGFKVFPSDILDSLRGMREVDLFKKEDFSSVLRANLVTTDMEWKLFGELFDEFWQEIEDEKEEEKTEDPHQEMECKGDSVEEVTLEITPDLRSPGEDACKKESMEGASYSPVSVLKKKDLALFQKGDIQIAQLILKDIISQFRVAVARRFKRSKKPAYMDFRRIFKKSLRAGGIPLELFYKKKKKRLKRLVILTDVSGSMDRYARFVIPFIMGLKGMGSRAHAFVFSTSLTPITPFLRSLPLDEALERIAHEVLDWSGGTRIGYSLHQFNQVYGARLLNRKTVVIIMSDGWDLGGRELLRKEMETLNRNAHCIIWLNPLAGDTEYRPVCQGMRISLPYVDYFLPADSLKSLKKVGRTLSKVMTA